MSANVVMPALRPPQTTAQQGVVSVLQLPPLQTRFNQTFRQSWWAYLACVLVLAASIAKGGGIRHYAGRVRHYRQTEWKPAAQPLELDNAKTQLFGSVAGDLHEHIRKIVSNAKQGGSVKGIPELAQQMEQQAALMLHLASQLAELGRAGAEKPHLATLSLPETPATACGLDASGSIRNTPKKPLWKAVSTAHPVLLSLNARHSAPDWQTGTGSIGLETPADQEFLKRFNREAEAHLADGNFGVNELLRELGTSRTRLHRKLKAATGQSAHELLRGIRMQKAMHLLRTTSLPVAEVASRVGFGSPSHFAKVFGEYFGSTPSATREPAAAA